MNLAKEISFLLYKHSCVILPGFGAFLINDKAAERNEIAKYALPKKQIISFNRQIVNNDGLLANHLSTTTHCSYELGVQKVETYIAQLWDILRDKRNAEVAEVGTFYYTKEDKIVFVPYHSVNFATSSFGLPKLRLKQLSATPAIAKPIIEQAPVKKVEPQKVVVEKPVFALPTIEAQSTIVPKKKLRNEKIQANKLEKKTKEKKQSEPFKISSLGIINALGSLFLIAMVFALLNFENSNDGQGLTDTQIASLLDTPASEAADIDLANSSDLVITPEKKIVFYGIYAKTKNSREASELLNDLMDKYAQSELTISEDGKPEVFIISFSSEELANEYKNLIQNKIDHKLVIKQN
ncbi:hypothetical protein N8368_01785 [Bacteroidia bacterium]|nr:hypothetical protein [Bacteroidia bacterium]MDC1395220.1 hypothetical protein [Bacteroidia bacterium]